MTTTPPLTSIAPQDSLPAILARLADRLERPVVLPLLMDVNAAAEFMGISRASIYRLASSGVLPGVQVDGRAAPMWRRRDLEAYVAGLVPAARAGRRGGRRGD